MSGRGRANGSRSERWSLGRAVRRWPDRGILLWIFIGLTIGIAVGASLLGVPEAGARLVIAGITTAALVVGIRAHRPDVASGWWFIAAGTVATTLNAAATLLIMARAGSDGPGYLIDFLPSVTHYAFLIIGLALLARLRGRTDYTDLLDATMIALAIFLMLFALVIDAAIPPGWYPLAIAVVYPLEALLVLAMVIRLALTVGFPTLSLGLLMLAMLTRVGARVALLVPALTTGTPQIGPVAQTLSMTSFILLGAAALHPSLARTRYRGRVGQRSVTRRRIVLLIAVAVAAPVTLVLEIREAVRLDTLGVTVPPIAAALLLALLAIRLSITARIAQRRATELAQRSDDLAEAVQEQQALEQQLRHQALHDPLTGLANRIVLTERMEWAFTRPGGTRQHALALFDLDHFKDVNDTLGHPTGDELLVDVAHRLLAAVPPGGTLARLGGDEFAVLLEDTSGTAAQVWAEQIRDSIRRPYRVGGEEFHLSTSVGLLTIEPTAPLPSPTDALRDADLALYAAKAAGRDQVMLFRAELRTAQMNLTRLSAGLRHALSNQELEIHYQPVVSLATGRAVAVEALLRWEPPDRAPITPAEFIPVAEESGLISEIGAWVLRRACQDTRPWYEEHHVAAAVNVSPRQLDDPGFADTVLRALREASLPGQALILEITETSLVATPETSRAMSQLERLRTHGVRVAIDDFGTGYSSLAYVNRLPVDIVKLDRTFVSHTHPADPRWAFTRAILHMVESLRLEAIAEGVETHEQVEALRELRCELVQGFLFGRPMPRQLIASSLAALRLPIR